MRHAELHIQHKSATEYIGDICNDYVYSVEIFCSVLGNNGAYDDIRNTAQYVINNIDKYTAKTKAFAKTEFPLPYMMGINDTNGLEPTFAASEMLWMPISTVDISKISYAIC